MQDNKKEKCYKIGWKEANLMIDDGKNKVDERKKKKLENNKIWLQLNTNECKLFDGSLRFLSNAL